MVKKPGNLTYSENYNKNFKLLNGQPPSTTIPFLHCQCQLLIAPLCKVKIAEWCDNWLESKPVSYSWFPARVGM
jgi:hypothetical protein